MPVARRKNIDDSSCLVERMHREVTAANAGRGACPYKGVRSRERDTGASGKHLYAAVCCNDHPAPPSPRYSLHVGMLRAEKGGENGGGAARAAGPREASLDLAEELFVSCRFTEAARVCNDALSTAAAPSGDSSGSGPGGSAVVVTFEDQVIAPVGECDTADLIVAVLLQCGFELRRTEEWRRCRAYYGESAMPFAVAILWLRLRLAGGEFELVRRVLWQLRAALGGELLRRPTTTTAADNDQATAPHSSRGTTATPTALANYSEATEMLVVQIMLPCGESGEASALVSSDRYLGPEDKGRLLKACELSAARTPEEAAREAGTPAGGGGAAPRATSAPASGSGSSRSHSGGARRAASGRPGRDGQTRFGEHLDPPPDHEAAGRGPRQQGPVQKFLSDVSDWTPEVRIQLVVGAGAAGFAAYAALRNRGFLLRAARGAASAAARTAGDIGAFIVGSS